MQRWSLCTALSVYLVVAIIHASHVLDWLARDEIKNTENRTQQSETVKYI